MRPRMTCKVTTAEAANEAVLRGGVKEDAAMDSAKLTVSEEPSKKGTAKGAAPQEVCV